MSNDNDEVFRRGVANRKKVMGEAHVARSSAAVDEFSAPLTDVAMRFCWGELWSREGLDWKVRSLVNIGMMAAMNRPNELKLHVAGAIRNGATKEEIREVLMQVVVYCGLPAANQAFKLAKETFAELEASA
jgi:4-carboxymuconolactone decarboxylase